MSSDNIHNSRFFYSNQYTSEKQKELLANKQQAMHWFQRANQFKCTTPGRTYAQVVSTHTIKQANNFSPKSEYVVLTYKPVISVPNTTISEKTDKHPKVRKNPIGATGPSGVNQMANDTCPVLCRNRYAALEHTVTSDDNVAHVTNPDYGVLPPKPKRSSRPTIVKCTEIPTGKVMYHSKETVDGHKKCSKVQCTYETVPDPVPVLHVDKTVTEAGCVSNKSQSQQQVEPDSQSTCGPVIDTHDHQEVPDCSSLTTNNTQQCRIHRVSLARNLGSQNRLVNQDFDNSDHLTVTNLIGQDCMAQCDVLDLDQNNT